MKALHLIYTTAIVLGLGALVAFPLAQARQAEAQDAATPEATDEEVNPLHDAMEVLQQNLRTMRKLLRSPEDKGNALAACSAMEDSIRTALAHPPVRGESGELEGSELLVHQIAFKQKMLETYSVVLELETALDSGDAEAAKKAYRALGQNLSLIHI